MQVHNLALLEALWDELYDVLVTFVDLQIPKVSASRVIAGVFCSTCEGSEFSDRLG